MEVVGLPAIRTGRLYLTENTPGTHFLLRLSRVHAQSAAGRIISMKNSSDTVGNQTRDLPACSVVPQPTAQLRVLQIKLTLLNVQRTIGLPISQFF